MPTYAVFNASAVQINLVRAANETSAMTDPLASYAVLLDDDIDEITLKFRESVNTKRAKLIVAGTTVDVTGYGLVDLQGRPEDQATLHGLAFAAQIQISMGSTTPTNFLDRSNVQHTLTPSQVIDLWIKGASFMSQIYALSWAIKEMNPQTTDPDDAALWVIV
jgi:hypothetical protein